MPIAVEVEILVVLLANLLLATPMGDGTSFYVMTEDQIIATTAFDLDEDLLEQTGYGQCPLVSSHLERGTT